MCIRDRRTTCALIRRSRFDALLRQEREDLDGRLPSDQLDKAATTDQRAGGAHAGFPFVPLPVAFAVAEGKRSFGVVYGAFEKIARQRRALYDTAQQALV